MPPALLWPGIVHITWCLDAGLGCTVNFYFPTFRTTEVPMRGTSAKCVDEYVATVHDQLRATLQASSGPVSGRSPVAEAQWQKWYYNQKIGAMELKPGDLVLVKADAFKGKRKIKDRWEDEAYEVVCQIMQPTSPPTKWWTNAWTVMHPPLKPTSSHHASETCAFPWVWVSAKHGTDVPAPPKLSQLPRGVNVMNMPWVDSGLVITQCQASKTSLGCINGKLWRSSVDIHHGASTDDGWRLQVMCSGSGCLQDHMCI